MNLKDKFLSRTDSAKQIPAINGLVLSGGESKRMGQDKGEINYYNKSQRRHLYELLLPFCKEVLISCNNEQSKHIVDLPKIEDTYLDIGPMAGILSAFQYDSNAAWLTIPCDLPFINEETISYLINHRDDSKMATTFWSADEKFPEPLVTIWEPPVYPVLLQYLAQDGSSLSQILVDSNTEMLHTPNTQALKNVNTAEEYSQALIQLHRQ